MPVTLIDSNIVIDSKIKIPGSRHELAAGIVRAIDQGDFPTARVTNYALLESLNWIHE
jgi:hypothetical protein